MKLGIEKLHKKIRFITSCNNLKPNDIHNYMRYYHFNRRTSIKYLFGVQSEVGYWVENIAELIRQKSE